jgi:hypothetical protein
MSMKDVAQYYQQFQKAVIDGDNASVLPTIRPHARLHPEQQLGIYQHGYQIRLIQAIASDYPALKAYLTQPRFDALAQAYVQAHPSHTPNLDSYPHRFADYIAIHQPDTFATALATLEQAITVTFMGPESDALMPQALEGISPDAFGAMVLRLRPASRLLALAYPVNQWLDAQRHGGMVLPVPSAQPTYVYVYRHPYDVQRMELDEAAFALLSRLGQGASVGAALERMGEETPQHMEQVAANLQDWFARWLADGVFAVA